jgi:serine/threonine-protein kinase
MGEPIDAGAAATVYDGQDEKHRWRVAIKVLDPMADHAVAAERFTREIGLIAGFQHPNILPLYDSGEIAGVQYYIMPFTTGKSLGDRLAHDGPLPIDMATRLGIEIADALAYAHQRGVVHRDVKPANILFEGEHVVLADFGAATTPPRLDTAHTGSEGPTGHGGFVGTLSYMAPEQLLGEAVDGRADVYALGAVIFEAIAGRLPVVGRNASELAQKKLSGAHEPLDRVVAGVPDGLRELLDRAMAPRPEDRQMSAAEFQAALEVLRGPGPVLPRRRSSPMATPARRLLLGAAALLGIGGLLWRVLRPATLDPRRVVVAGFTDETRQPDLVPLGDQIEAWITDSLAHLGTLEVISAAVDLPIRRPRGDSGPETSPERLARLARETRAGTVVAGSIFRQDDQLEVSVEVTDARNGELRSAIGPMRGSRADADGMVRLVGGSWSAQWTRCSINAGLAREPTVAER